MSGDARGPRCDVCGGEGLLELRQLRDGRFACPVCRHEAILRDIRADVRELRELER